MILFKFRCVCGTLVITEEEDRIQCASCDSCKSPLTHFQCQCGALVYTDDPTQDTCMNCLLQIEANKPLVEKQYKQTNRTPVYSPFRDEDFSF